MYPDWLPDDEPPEDPSIIEKILVFLILWVIVLTGLATMAGCVSAPIAPNLKIPETSCSRLSMPAIPETVLIEIHGLDIKTNQAGEELLRAYVKAREILK